MAKRLTLLLMVLLQPLAGQAAVAVVVNRANPVTTLTQEQAAHYFLGRVTTLTPIDVNGRSALRNQFYLKVAGKDAEQVRAIWSKIVFTGRGFPPREYATSEEIKRAVAADPAAIAYIDASDLDDTVKVVLTLP